jgi:hypothetical protein
MRLTYVSCYVFMIVEYLLAKINCVVRTTLQEGLVHIFGFQKHSTVCSAEWFNFL